MKNSLLWVSLLIAAACYFPLFMHLDVVGLYRWDESTNALHAMEMLETGDFLIRRYEGAPDHWETKPPLLIWCQVICTKLLGPGELAIRMPSALAGLGTAAMIFLFFWRDLKRPIMAVSAVMALVTAQGYIRIHGTRTGDHDALLILFLVWGLLAAYRYVNTTGRARDRALLWLALAVTGGVMSKSIAGFFYLPGIFLYFILSKQFLPTLRNPVLYIGMGLFLLIVLGYYLLRNVYDPEYLYHVSQNELFHRYLNTAETWDYNIPPNRWYYLRMMIEQHFSSFFWAPILGIGVGFWQQDQAIRSLTLLLSLTLVIFMTSVSFGTVNEWYAAPAIPLMAMLTGCLIGVLYRALSPYLKLEKGSASLSFFTGILLVSLFVSPYVSVVRSIYKPQPRRADMAMGNFIRNVLKQQPDRNNLWVYSECNNRHVMYYQSIYQQKGVDIHTCMPCGDISGCELPRPGTWVMICEEPYLSQFEALGIASQTYEWKGCKLYQVNAATADPTTP